MTSFLSLALAVLLSAPSFLSDSPVLQMRSALRIHAPKIDPPQILFSLVGRSLEPEKLVINQSGLSQGLADPISAVPGTDLNEIIANRQVIPTQRLGEIGAKRFSLKVIRQDGFRDEFIVKSELEKTNFETPPPKRIVQESKMLVPPGNGSFLLQGEVMLVDGASLGDRRLTLEFTPPKSGASPMAIDPKKPSFQKEIYTWAGVVSAKVIDHEGKIVAFGMTDLSNDLKPNQFARIKVRPSESGYRGHNYDQNTENLFPVSPADEPVAARVQNTNLDIEEKTDRSGLAHFDNLEAGSVSLLRVEAKNRFPTLFVSAKKKALSGSKSIPLFSNSLVRAMQDIHQQYSLSGDPSNDNLAWGQIMSVSGHPIQGARLFIEGHEDKKPVHLSLHNGILIPDRALERTSAVAQATFANLIPGLYTIKAEKSGNIIGETTVLIEQGHISPFEIIEKLPTTPEPLEFVEAFTDVPVELENRQKIAARALNPEDPLAHLFFESPNPEISPAIIMTSPVLVENRKVPVIKKSWLTGTMGANTMSQLYSGQSSIVVFAPEGGDFEIFLEPEAPLSADQIKFFNKQGEIVASAQDGGGFIITKVPIGLQSLTVLNKASNKALTNLILIAEEAPSIVQLSF